MAPDLTLPAEPPRVADLVAREYARHVQHTLDCAASDLAERAARLRASPLAADPLTSALLARCHAHAGLVYAHPSVVAAVAYEVVAVLLVGQYPAVPERDGADPNETERLETTEVTPHGHI